MLVSSSPAERAATASSRIVARPSATRPSMTSSFASSLAIHPGGSPFGPVHELACFGQQCPGLREATVIRLDLRERIEPVVPECVPHLARRGGLDLVEEAARAVPAAREADAFTAGELEEVERCLERQLRVPDTPGNLAGAHREVRSTRTGIDIPVRIREEEEDPGALDVGERGGHVVDRAPEQDECLPVRREPHCVLAGREGGRERLRGQPGALEMHRRMGCRRPVQLARKLRRPGMEPTAITRRHGSIQRVAKQLVPEVELAARCGARRGRRGREAPGSGHQAPRRADLSRRRARTGRTTGR